MWDNMPGAMIKIDYDHKSIDAYIKKILPICEILAYKGIKFHCVSVYTTKHGLHIYFSVEGLFSNTEILLIESLLYSDLRKQAINYVEDSDILFREKKGVPGKYSGELTKKVRKALGTVYKKSFRYEKVILKR